MNDVNESIAKAIADGAYTISNADGTTGTLTPWGGSVPEGWERQLPSVIINQVGGTIDRMFRPVGGSVTPKIETSRVQTDFYWRWQGDMTPFRALFQKVVYALEDSQITLVGNSIPTPPGGVRLFVVMWRDGLERESVEDKMALISQDWQFSILRGP